MATLLIRFTQAPYTSGKSQEGLEFALAATNYGHIVHVLFEGEGVLQLVKTDAVNTLKNHSKRLASMPFFDIEACFICQDSARQWDISALLANTDVAAELDAHYVDAPARISLINSADHVVTF